MSGRFLLIAVSALCLGPLERTSWSQAAGATPPKPSAPVAETPKDPDGKLEASAFGLPGEDPPRAFVPRTPRSVADLKKVEALRAFASGCSLEAQGKWSDALASFEAAAKADPEASGALRRMARLSFALNKSDKAIELCKRVLQADPGDIDTLTLLINHYRGRRNDPTAAEQVLRTALENRKLDPNSTAALLIHFELGRNYAATQKLDKAAESFLKVIAGLDDKAGRDLTPAERRRILGNDEAQAYLEFGLIFLATKRVDAAIESFEHGLVYDPEDPQLLLLLGRSFQESGKKSEALGVIERYLRRQPSGREPYDLLVKILIDLKREAEILPRLEAASKTNPKNVALQYLLAERYRAAGQEEKAAELTKALVARQPDLQGLVAVFPSLLKEKKADELLRILDSVVTKVGNIQVVMPQLEKIAEDQAFSEQVLDRGLALLSTRNAPLNRSSWFFLLRLATQAKRPQKLVGLLRWAIDQNPPLTPGAVPSLYRELVLVEFELGNFAKAEEVVESLLRKFPDERTAQTLVLLGQVRARGGKMEPAITALKDALKLEPNDGQALQVLGLVLSQSGRSEEAIQIIRDALKLDPGNVQNNLTLASLLVQAGKSDDAIAHYKSVLEKFPNNDEVVRIARSNLSIIYTGKGDFAKGEAELEILFAKDANDAGVNNDLGYLYADQGKNLEKAEAMIRKAVAQEPDNASYLDSLGWVLFKRGKIKEAVEPLEKALKNLQNDDATIYEHLGDVYFQLKDLAKARVHWEKAEGIAAKSRPPDKRLPEIRKKLENLKVLQASPRPASGVSP